MKKKIEYNVCDISFYKIGLSHNNLLEFSTWLDDIIKNKIPHDCIENARIEIYCEHEQYDLDPSPFIEITYYRD